MDTNILDSCGYKNLLISFNSMSRPFSYCSPLDKGDNSEYMEYGYFESPLSEVPDYDPGLDVDCPVCYRRLSRPMKTISVAVEGDNKSYFYRVHSRCFERLSPDGKSELDSFIIDAVMRTKRLN